MIERISGQVVEKTPGFCVLDCHGFGIGVHISLQSFQALAEVGERSDLYTHLHVREDLLQLYGFSDRAERELFQLLITISGVGPKLALAILSGSSSRDLRNAIALEDVGMLTRIPGVGKKTAQRLILELREKVPGIITESSGMAASAPVATSAAGMTYEAMQALLALGFKDADARRKVEAAKKASGEDVGLSELVKRALKET